MRVGRNWLVQKFISGLFTLTKYSFRFFKPYIQSDHLRQLQLTLQDLDATITKELLLRKKIISNTNTVESDSILRDSSVLNATMLNSLKSRAPPSGGNADVIDLDRTSISAYQRRKMNVNKQSVLISSSNPLNQYEQGTKKRITNDLDTSVTSKSSQRNKNNQSVIVSDVYGSNQEDEDLLE